MFNTKKSLLRYLSDFYRTTDLKLNALSAQMRDFQEHVTKLHGLEYPPERMPSAVGHTKLIQDGCLKLLRMIDLVLVDAGIKYFLGYGNLLSAARNGGYFAWDDDADICLMREDFDRAVPLLTKLFNNEAANAQGFSVSWGISGGIFKVLFQNRICVDLFPWDYYHKEIESIEEHDEFIQKYNVAMIEARNQEGMIEQQRKNDENYFGPAFPNYKKIRDEIIMNGLPADMTHGAIFEGVDWQTYPERQIGFTHSKPFKHEWLFPLSSVEFCGYIFPAPNNLDAWLVTRYNDWKSFRPSFFRHSVPKFTYDQIIKIREFIDDQNIDIRNV